MPGSTPNVGLQKPLESESADISVLNENMDKIDLALGDLASVPTVAKDAAGAITELHEAIEHADIPDATLTAKGKVQLSNATNSAAENLAATPKAVRDSLQGHADQMVVHGATSAATVNRLIIRDGSGRAKVATPAAYDDIARLDSITKTQTGLGNVDNYGTATQAEAESGTAANKFMTPQRTKQYVDTRLLNNVNLRVNAGALEYNDGTEWVGVWGDPTLSNFFGHFGTFPFAGTQDVTISSNTIWDDILGYRRIKKLTINSGVTLRIMRSPFMIFADEILFGNTNSTIDISGPSGSASGTAFTPHSFASGGHVGGTTNPVQGGCGGGLIVIVAKKISGTAGRILANGGDAYSSTGSFSSNVYVEGQGALGFATTSSNRTPSFYLAHSTRRSMEYLLGHGGASSSSIGSSGGGSGSPPSGGSGIGGGGGAVSIQSGSWSGKQPILSPQLNDMLMLALAGCLGGGGGGAFGNNNTGSRSNAGGGGGGGVVLIARQFSATPTMTANGGQGTANNHGAAGVTMLVQV